MDLAIEILKILASWPIAAVAISFMFRSQISELLGKVGRAKISGLEIDLEAGSTEEELAEMVKFHNQEFRNTRVELDGRVFDGCKFYNCELVYRASKPIELKHCEFYETGFLFSDGATLTLSLLEGMYHGMGEGGKKIFESLIKAIQEGKVPRSA